MSFWHIAFVKNGKCIMGIIVTLFDMNYYYLVSERKVMCIFCFGQMYCMSESW